MPAQRSGGTPEADEIVRYWVDEVGPKGWYAVDEVLDAQIRDRYMGHWHEARVGHLDHWLASADGMLAFIILTDQFPRNMFRGAGKSFATDRHARRAAEQAIHRRWDLRVPEPQRQFFYLPLMHSECRTDQDRCVRLILTRLPETGADNLLHARAHRAVIRLFGRFPYRNEALGRETTEPEAAYLKAGGYGATVRELQDAA